MKPLYLSIITRYLLAEFILYIPSINELTTISKFMVQLILLATAAFELYRNWQKRKKEKVNDTGPNNATQRP